MRYGPGILLTFLLIACSSLPPEPGTPGATPVGQPIEVLKGIVDSKWAVPPTDVFTGDALSTVAEVSVLRRSDTTLELDVDISMKGGFIHDSAYYFDHGGNHWQEFTFEDGTKDGRWFSHDASTTIRINRVELDFDNPNYIIFHACKKIKDEFRCSCKTKEDCSSNYYNIVAFTVHDAPDLAEEACEVAGGTWLGDHDHPCCGDDVNEFIRENATERFCCESEDMEIIGGICQVPELNKPNSAQGTIPELKSAVEEKGDAASENIDEDTPNEQITTHAVTISDFSFGPRELTITVGDTVVWTNEDTAGHTVTLDSGAELDSDLLATGETYSHTFTEVGEFSYHCTPHPSMKAKIIVSSR